MSCPDSYNPGNDRSAARSEAAQRFVSVIAQHDHRPAHDRSELREAAWAYVAELKGKSLPPERVLVHIKDLLRMQSVSDDDVQQRQLLQQVITWCIEAYYRGDDPSLD